MCHASSGDVCHMLSDGGVPTMPSYLTCLFCPSKMGGLKIIGFFETEVTFCAHWVTWRAGVKSEKSIYDEPSSLCIPRQRVVSMMA